MSIISSIEKLKREIAYKKMLFIDGNVQDVYLHEGQFLKLNKYLIQHIKEAKLLKTFMFGTELKGL